MKTIVISLTAALAVSTFAQAAAPASGKREMTPEERAAMAEKMKQATGGMIARPDSMKGKIAFIDLQAKYVMTNAQHMIDTLVGGTCYNIRYEKDSAKFDLGGAADLLKSHKAQIGIIMVDDAAGALPPMLVAPEAGWAVVNVARLEKNLPDGKLGKVIFNARCRKEIMRAFSIVCGGSGSPYRGSAINAATIEELDKTDDFIPFDTIQVYKPYLRSFGVTPELITTYRRAVVEGWAPAPTNEYQKIAYERALVEKAKREAKKAEKAKSN